MLLREETDPERRHALALISAQATRVYEMIADMMLFARPPRPELQQVELVKLVDDLVAELLPRCARQETAIHRTGAAGPILIEADPIQISVALRAICQNAIEALQSGGHIVLECGDLSPPSADGPNPRNTATQGESGDESPHSKRREVRICIRDDGPG